MFTSGVNMLLFKVFLLCQLPFQEMIYYNRSCVLCAVEKGENLDVASRVSYVSLDWDWEAWGYLLPRDVTDYLSPQITG